MPDPALLKTILEAKGALLLSGRELGELVGSSERTVARWWSGQTAPSPPHVASLAIAVHPRDPAIARRLAAHIGQSLESLGLAPRPAPPAPVEPTPLPALEPTLPPVLVPILTESVVAAAAEALDVSPRVARPALLAALERATAAGLSVQDMLDVLRPPAKAAKKTPAKKTEE